MHEQPCQRACARATPVRTHPYMCMYHLNECHPNTPPRIARPTDSTGWIRAKDDTPSIGCAIDTNADAQNCFGAHATDACPRGSDALEDARPIA